MVRIEYTVRLISGDYAHLADENRNEICMARALLPETIAQGKCVIFENFEFTCAD